jgi:hypothetical protein
LDPSSSNKRRISNDADDAAGYTEWVRKDIVAMLRRKRQARGHTFDDLRDENVDFVLPNSNGNLRPGNPQNEETAAGLLLTGNVRFAFAPHGAVKNIKFT